MQPGKFVATWEGDLRMRLRDSYAFSALGRGKLTVTINDQVALETAGEDLSKVAGQEVRLNKGKNKLVVRYESPDAGDAWVRLLWVVKGESFSEPVPPSVFEHNAAATGLAESLRVREGRFLLGQLRCTKCHEAPAPAGATSPMPELAMDAPALTAAGERLDRQWMAAWIKNPKAMRPDAHMPRLFRDDASAADVAAYLASLGGKPAAAAAPPAADAVEAGGKLFANLNCIACHTAPDAAAPEAAPENAETEPARPRVALRFVKAKYTPAGLRQYLHAPHALYAWNPMPDFKLSQPEADALAAYLLANSQEIFPHADAIPEGDAAKGKQLVESSGCLQCHVIGDQKSTLKAPALAAIPKEGWSRGCIADDAAAGKSAPQYGLSNAELSALRAFAGTDRSSLAREAAPEFAERQIAAMNCVACHSRDGAESLLSTVYDQELKDLQAKFPPPQGENAEAFAPDQRAPLLTWAGEKLRPEWASRFLAGQVPYKPRPYLHARMPAFSARAKLLAAGLAQGHGCPPVSEPVAKPDAAMAAAGMKLAGKTPNESFSCVQCHAVAAQPASSPFEAPAVNFRHTSERIRKDYYDRWLHNPLRLDPNTKMPAFERDDGTTAINTVFDGNARKQFDAIWHYLLAGDAIKPPAE